MSIVISDRFVIGPVHRQRPSPCALLHLVPLLLHFLFLEYFSMKKNLHFPFFFHPTGCRANCGSNRPLNNKVTLRAIFEPKRPLAPLILAYSFLKKLRDEGGISLSCTLPAAASSAAKPQSSLNALRVKSSTAT